MKMNSGTNGGGRFEGRKERDEGPLNAMLLKEGAREVQMMNGREMLAWRGMRQVHVEGTKKEWYRSVEGVYWA